jgi:tetratricopeptide (TPR) repeat protein
MSVSFQRQKTNAAPLRLQPGYQRLKEKVEMRPSSWLRSLMLGVAGLMALVFAGSLSCPVPAKAQAAVEYTEKKQHALDLYRQNKMVDAATELEKLAAVNDKDVEVFSALGFALFASIETAQNDQDRAQLASRARAALRRAQELGDKNVVTDMALARLKDGTPPVKKFSPNPEADLAMQQAEADFVKGNLDQAIDLYQKALNADPKLYDAAVYIGDAYYKSPGSMNKAPEWYARAIAIDPDRETAYRYWADVLMKQGDVPGARDKYVEAYISEPHSRLAVTGFTDFAKAQHVTLAHPAVTVPTSFTREKNGNSNITLDPSTLGKKNKEDGSSAWIMYGMARASWTEEKFRKEYPDEKTYRHSLREEADALRTVLAGIDKKARQSKDLDPSLATLLKLDQKDELEAYILLVKSDEGIAQDYPWYLRKHRDQLRAYVVDWVLSGGQAK